ncbi:uncharacterized protein V2V93DRAFT_372719 [Kockiozyma suomiensis]|uniref:uncharacterized protein n=1 Tax=Kockiozyma suomiensis TaxID=1337062 RepID=UPI003342F965
MRPALTCKLIRQWSRTALRESCIFTGRFPYNGYSVSSSTLPAGVAVVGLQGRGRRLTVCRRFHLSVSRKLKSSADESCERSLSSISLSDYLDSLDNGDTVADIRSQTKMRRRLEKSTKMPAVSTRTVEEQPGPVPFRDIRFAHNYAWVPPDDGVFQPQVSIDRERSAAKFYYTPWQPPDHMSETANLPLSFFVENLIHELNTLPRYPEPRIVECRILPILQRARNNQKSYNLLKELRQREIGRPERRLMFCLCSAFSRPGVAPFVFEGLITLFFSAPVPELITQFHNIASKSPLADVCRKLSPPNHQAEKDPVSWVLAEIFDADSRGYPDRARKALAILSVQLALACNEEVIATAMIVRLLRDGGRLLSDGVQANYLLPTVVIRSAIDQLLVSMNYDQSVERLRAVALLWNEMIKENQFLTREQQFSIMEKALQITDRENDSLRTSTDLATFTEPISILELISKQEQQQQESAMVPTTFYTDVIQRLLKVGNLLEAASQLENMISRPGFTINMAPAEVIAQVVRALSKRRLYSRAQEIVLQFNRALVTNEHIQAVLLNFAARTNNFVLAKQMMKLVTPPYSRVILRELLFLSVRFHDASGREAVMSMISQDDKSISPAEYSLLIEDMIDSEGLIAAYDEVGKSKSSTHREFAWSTLLHKSLNQKEFAIASEGTNKIRRQRGDYYLAGLLIYVSKNFGSATARRVLQKRIKQTVDVESLKSRRNSAESKKSANISKIRYLRTITEILDMNDEPVEFDLKSSGIDPKLFLPRNEGRSKGYRRRPRSSESDFSTENMTDNSSEDSLTADRFDESIFDYTKPSLLAVQCVATFALFSGDARTYNWALITLETMGLAPRHIKTLFKTDLEEFKFRQKYANEETPMRSQAENDIIDDTLIKSQGLEILEQDEDLTLKKIDKQYTINMRELIKSGDLSNSESQSRITKMENEGEFHYDPNEFIINENDPLITPDLQKKVENSINSSGNRVVESFNTRFTAVARRRSDEEESDELDKLVL